MNNLKAIATQHPQRDSRSSLLNNFNFRVFLFQDMDDGDSIVISARVIACVEAIDCSPVSDQSVQCWSFFLMWNNFEKCRLCVRMTVAKDLAGEGEEATGSTGLDLSMEMMTQSTFRGKLVKSWLNKESFQMELLLQHQLIIWRDGKAIWLYALPCLEVIHFC